MSLVIGVLVLGAVIGGSFLGGLAMGKGQEAVAASSIVQPPQPAGQADGETVGQLREQLQSGQLSQQELAQLRQQFQGQFAAGGESRIAGGTGFGGRGGLTGTIEEIDGSTVTVNTDQGPLRATVGADTTIHMFAVGALEDLLEGMRVTVVGERTEEGTVEATTFLVLPEGEESFFGGEGSLGGRRQRNQGSP